LASYYADSAAEPFAKRFAVYLRWSLGLTLLFLVTYGSTNWLASQRATRFRLYFGWELGIPFIPWMIWVYLSVQAFLTAPLFVLNTSGIRRYGQVFGLVTLVAGLLHALFPTDLGWPRPQSVPGYPIFATLFAFDQPHNLLPSLHVAYSTLAFTVTWQSTERRWLKGLITVWLVLLICSVLLIHQHHIADIGTGALLAVVCERWPILQNRAANRTLS